MILVDASVWIDFFNGNPTPEVSLLDGLLGQQALIVGDLTLTEVLQGFLHEKEFRQAMALMRALEVVQLGGVEIALQAARNFRELRKRGVTIRKTIDVVIATWCIENDCRLLHRDRDFEPFVKHLGLRQVGE